MTPLEWMLLAVLGTLWGGTFFFNAIALPEVPPFAVITFRVAVASAILWGVIFLSGVRIPRERRVWIAVIVMAALNSALPFFLIAWGQLHIASGLAAIIIASSPLYAVVAAHFCTDDERMSPGRVAGVLSGFVGVVFLIGPGVLEGLGHGLFGQLAIVGAALCYAGSALYGRRFARWEISPMFVATGQMSMATVLLLPFLLFLEQPWSLAMPSTEAWAALLGLAVVSTALAYLIYFRILVARVR